MLADRNRWSLIGQKGTSKGHQLLDHFIRAKQERLWDVEPKLFCDGYIDYQKISVRLLDWQIARLRTRDDLRSIVGGQLENFVLIGPIRYQPTSVDYLSELIHRGNFV